MRRTHIGALLVACVATCGCTRTSDGSVVSTYSPTLPHFLYRDRPRETVSPRERMASLDRFPETPGNAGPRRARVRTTPPVRAWKMTGIDTPFNSGGSTRALNCHNEASPTGRIRVVCD